MAILLKTVAALDRAAARLDHLMNGHGPPAGGMVRDGKTARRRVKSMEIAAGFTPPLGTFYLAVYSTQCRATSKVSS
jgi:hypothetical protein